MKLRSIHQVPLESMERGVKLILEDKNYSNSVDPYVHTYAYIAKESYPG